MRYINVFTYYYYYYYTIYVTLDHINKYYLSRNKIKTLGCTYSI